MSVAVSARSSILDEDEARAKFKGEIQQVFSRISSLECRSSTSSASIQSRSCSVSVEERGAESSASSRPDLSAREYRTLMSQLLSPVTSLIGMYERQLEEDAQSRARLLEQLSNARETIEVFVRTRPVLASMRESEEGRAVTVFDDSNMTTVDAHNTIRSFAFDHCFGPQSGCSDLFDNAQHMASCAVRGMNASIICYGQTGSGKTYTLFGTKDSPGLAPRLFQRVLETATSSSSTQESSSSVAPVFSFSMIEIYNEEIYDLLDESRRIEVKLGGAQAVVESKAMRVRALSELRQLQEAGLRRRNTASTGLNDRSSRSHCILKLSVAMTNAHGVVTGGSLTLVDLAGSERVSKSGVSGERLVEAQNINSSLSALGNVMKALELKSKFIPYRDSKLTSVLRDSLSAHAKTLVIVTVCPTLDNLEESHCTLQFAAKVRRVQLGPAQAIVSNQSLEINQKRLKTRVLELQEENGAQATRIKELESELASLRQSSKNQEGTLKREAELARSRVTTLESMVKSLRQENNSLRSGLMLRSSAAGQPLSGFSYRPSMGGGAASGHESDSFREEAFLRRTHNGGGMPSDLLRTTPPQFPMNTISDLSGASSPMRSRRDAHKENLLPSQTLPPSSSDPSSVSLRGSKKPEVVGPDSRVSRKPTDETRPRPREPSVENNTAPRAPSVVFRSEALDDVVAPGVVPPASSSGPSKANPPPSGSSQATAAPLLSSSKAKPDVNAAAIVVMLTPAHRIPSSSSSSSQPPATAPIVRRVQRTTSRSPSRSSSNSRARPPPSVRTKPRVQPAPSASSSKASMTSSFARLKRAAEEKSKARTKNGIQAMPPSSLMTSLKASRSASQAAHAKPPSKAQKKASPSSSSSSASSASSKPIEAIAAVQSSKAKPMPPSQKGGEGAVRSPLPPSLPFSKNDVSASPMSLSSSTSSFVQFSRPKGWTPRLGGEKASNVIRGGGGGGGGGGAGLPSSHVVHIQVPPVPPPVIRGGRVAFHREAPVSFKTIASPPTDSPLCSTCVDVSGEAIYRKILSSKHPRQVNLCGTLLLRSLNPCLSAPSPLSTKEAAPHKRVARRA